MEPVIQINPTASLSDGWLPPSKVRVGISACLLGEPVRFDGGHKRSQFLVDVLSRYVEWVPVCPEIEAGLEVPREAMRLVDNGSGLRLMAPASGSDHTERLTAWSESRLKQLETLGLCGFVFKRASPSCGLKRVKVYRNTGLLHSEGSGLFAAAFSAHFQNLPVEEEGRLQDPRLRENFISSLLAYRRWRDLEQTGVTRRSVMEFHARHKFQLMAHHQDGARKLGTLTTAAREYFDLFCRVMRRIPTRGNHTNVLQHLAGYFSRDLNPSDRSELTEVIDGYRRAMVPLIVPLTMIRHYVRKHMVPYLENQVYLNPHPGDLSLLNEL